MISVIKLTEAFKGASSLLHIISINISARDGNGETHKELCLFLCFFFLFDCLFVRFIGWLILFGVVLFNFFQEVGCRQNRLQLVWKYGGKIPPS